MSPLLPAPIATASLVPAELVAKAAGYAEAGTAQATRRAYASAWRTFTAWCEAHGAEALPCRPETVALYVTAQAEVGRSVSSIHLALAAVKKAHEVAGLEAPTAAPVVRQVTRGIRRQIGTAPTRVKAPALVADIRRMVGTCAETAIGLRDRAVVLVGFAGAFRRAELVALDVADCQFGPDGVTITIRRSKTDQQGAGRVIGLPFGSVPGVCPVRALRAWMAHAGITSGPIVRGVSRHGQILGRLSAVGVARIVQHRAAACGLEAAQFGGHSLRAGFATAAAQAGRPERQIAHQTGHRNLQVLRRYIRAGELFSDNAAAGLL